jgi:hypothetical protein
MSAHGQDVKAAHVPGGKTADTGDVQTMSLMASTADVQPMSLTASTTADTTQYTPVWREDFTSSFGKMERRWGTVELKTGIDEATGQSVNEAVLTSTKASGWAQGGMMVPPTGASAGNGYGIYTIRAKTDPGEGPGPFATLWPATDKWPGPEIDIFEKVSKLDTDGYSTVHYKIENGTAAGKDGYDVYKYLPDFQFDMSKWHEYAMKWEPGKLSLSIDGTLVYSTNVHVPLDFAHGGQNSAFGVGMQPAWAAAQQNGDSNVLHVDWMSYAAPVEAPSPPPPTPTLSISDAPTVVEGGTLAFTVTLSAASAGAVTANYDFIYGTATAADHSATAGSITFAPGETIKTISVPTVDDAIVESTESLTVRLTSPSGATLADDQGVGSITDNDVAPPPPGMSVNDVTVSEGVAGGTMTFTVSLSTSNAGSSPITVNYATANGTAAAGTDYTAGTGSLSFAPGETTKTVAVAITNDTVVEPDETLTLNLSSPSGATLTDVSGTGTITNDDSAPLVTPGLRVTDASVAEGGQLNFTVSLSTANAGTTPITVSYGTVSGTASSAASDYTARSGSLSFAPGELSKVVTVQTNDDAVAETNETMTLRLTTPTGATLADADGLGTITDGRVVTGTSGANTLTGSLGDDRITGARGNDVMTGQTGADDFVFSRFDGFDRIKYFVPGLDDLVLNSISSTSVRAAPGTSNGVSGMDVRYGPSGDHVFLENVSSFSISNDVIFA